MTIDPIQFTMACALVGQFLAMVRMAMTFEKRFTTMEVHIGYLREELKLRDHRRDLQID